jgi:hypothetical protein
MMLLPQFHHVEALRTTLSREGLLSPGKKAIVEKQVCRRKRE